MKYAVTGDIPVAGNKEANICQLADTTESSYVSFTFQHGGAEATVIRYLRPDRPSELIITGEDPITGDRRINPRIEALLGVDRKILDTIVMVDQGDIFGFLDQKPAKRAEAFAKIFRTDQAEVCWKALGEHIRSRPVIATDVDCDALRSEIAGLEAELARLLDVIGDDSSEALRVSLAAHQSTVTEYDRKEDYRRQAVEAQGQQATINATIKQIEATIAENEANVATLQEAADGCADAAQAAKTALANLAHIAAVNKRKEALRVRISGYENTLMVPGPEKPDDYDQDIDKQTRLIESLVATLHADEAFVESFDPEKGMAECPTCHTPVDNLEDKLSEVRRDLPAKRGNVHNLRLIRERNYKYKTELAKYEEEQRRIRAQLDEAKGDLEALETAPAPPAQTEDELKQQVQEHADYTSAIAEYNKVVNDAKVQLGRLEGQVSQLKSREEALTEQFTQIAISEGEAATASQEVERLAARINTVYQAEGTSISTAAALELRRQRLADGLAAARSQEIVTTWVQRLGPVRDLLHREAAPRFVSQRNLQRIQVAVNEHLERFDTDFRVRADEGLSFVARFNDNRQQPAERLSGGQKVVLALAFRLAVNFMYSDLGFLSLDEPTAYLDAHHIAGFEPSLNRLREYATSRGLQCIMVTHEQSLAHLFDSVIQL
jgi:DNA repair exonuclease SbcCD ATPase subunit